MGELNCPTRDGTCPTVHPPGPGGKPESRPAEAAAPERTPKGEGRGRLWAGRRRGGVLGNWIFLVLVRGIGLRWGYALLIPVSLYYLLFAPKARRASCAYLSRIRGGRGSWLAQQWWAYRHFLAFGQILLDRFAMVGRPESLAARFHFELEGEEHLYAAVKEGKGAVLVTSHCGNWEAAAHLLQRIQVPVNVVAYRGEAAGMREFFERASKGRHFSLLVADGSPDVTLAILAALSRGEVVAMHADRALTAQGERIPFLGAPAWFPTGPYLVAAASGAPLVHTFAMREGTYRYHFYAYPPEHLSLPAQPGAAQDRELLRDCAARFVGRLEEKVRQYPLQWHNFYDFWEVGRLRDERRRTKGG